MIYDIAIASLMAAGLVLCAVGTYELEKARKAGKIRYIGKVRIEPKRPAEMDKPE